MREGIVIGFQLDAVEIASAVQALDGAARGAGQLQLQKWLCPPWSASTEPKASARMSVEVVADPTALLPWQAFLRRVESDARLGQAARLPLVSWLAANDFRAQWLVADGADQDTSHFCEAAPWRCELFDGYVRWGSARGLFELEFGKDPNTPGQYGVAEVELAPLLWLFENTLVKLTSQQPRPHELLVWTGRVAADRDDLRAWPELRNPTFLSAVRTVPGEPPAALHRRRRPTLRGRSEQPRRSEWRPAADPLAASLESDAAYSSHHWRRLVTSLSETNMSPSRELPTNESSLDYLISNEAAAHCVIPDLQKRVRRGSVYAGVGPEQNFTYIAAIQPDLAFIIDVRRDNQIAHLMYKALFELSTDRADFVSRLFSRRRSASLAADCTATDLFEAYRAVEEDAALYEDTVRAMVDRLVAGHEFPLSERDRADLARILKLFGNAGPWRAKSGSANNLSYAQLMAARDRTGRQWSYLASEEHFTTVQGLHRRNRIVPVVGDVAGDRALVGIGRYLQERHLSLGALYLSNVEEYLFRVNGGELAACQGGQEGQFYANLATLPVDRTSVFIRSLGSDISRTLGIGQPIGAERYRMFLCAIPDLLDDVAKGGIPTFRDLFTATRPGRSRVGRTANGHATSH